MQKPVDVVAVIDDDPLVLRSTANLLSAFGFTPQLYVSAEAFLADPEARGAGCLIVDAELDGTSAHELGRRLAGAGRQYPIIFTTERDDDPDVAQAMRAGSVACVRKPFFTGELIDALIKSLQL